jgi:hypothetical protein
MRKITYLAENADLQYGDEPGPLPYLPGITQAQQQVSAGRVDAGAV